MTVSKTIARAPVAALFSVPAASIDAEIRIAEERACDVAAREKLLDAAMPQRHQKSSERLREGRMPAEGLSLVALDGDDIVGTVRLWHVHAGPGRSALMLGPLAVAESHRSLGLGGKLVREALWRAAIRDHKAVLLVGDAPYYARFGFDADATRGLDMPGPVDRARFLALEIEPGALKGACGLVTPTGARMMHKAREPRPSQRRAA